MIPAVKICGVCSVEDAKLCIAAGADSIGLNFVPESPRRVDSATARAIVKTLSSMGSRALVVAVVANQSEHAIRALLNETGAACVQFHGDESPEALAPFLPHAYKAIRIRNAADVASADAFPGEYILVDAYSPDALGGTGKTFSWDLVVPLAARRKLSLAGGLTPENVKEAVRIVQPFCVDVASGVESAPRKKDAAKVRAFVANAKRG